jgi:hypothetical protein
MNLEFGNIFPILQNEMNMYRHIHESTGYARTVKGMDNKLMFSLETKI